MASLLVACGGSSSSSNDDGGEQAPPELVGARIVDPASAPPPGAVQVTGYYEFTNTPGTASSLLTLHIIKDIPEGYKINWYTYEDGAWTLITQANSLGGKDPLSQHSFAPRPANIVIFAEPE